MLLIQCTNSKRDETTAARNLYDKSLYFCKMRAYANSRDDAWRILSAKHGLVHPDDVLEPYDAYGLSENQAAAIATELEDRSIATVDVIAGQKYTKPLVPALRKRGVDVTILCEGMEIGERLSELNRLTSKKRHDSFW